MWIVSVSQRSPYNHDDVTGLKAAADLIWFVSYSVSNRRNNRPNYKHDRKIKMQQKIPTARSCGDSLELLTRFELVTSSLPRMCSTT